MRGENSGLISGNGRGMNNYSANNNQSVIQGLKTNQQSNTLGYQYSGTGEVVGKGVSQQSQGVMNSPSANEGPSSSQVGGYATTAINGMGSTMSQYNKFQNDMNYDVNAAFQNQQYNPYQKPPELQYQEMPDELKHKEVHKDAWNDKLGMMQNGAQQGGQYGGAWGSLIGGVVGAMKGNVGIVSRLTRAKKQRKQFRQKQRQQEMEYRQALDRYYDLRNRESTGMAQSDSFEKRGSNTVPYYNSQIYGFM